jgi:hypothetical protein
MKYVPPSAEELAARGIFAGTTVTPAPEPKKPSHIGAGAEMTRPTLREGPPPTPKVEEAE